MSQSVQLDMEVLQRIKFLMEYDVMKTSSENILLEQNVQSKLTYNQELAKRAGYGNVTSQKADELAVSGKLVYAAQQGLPLKTLMGTDPESKFRQSVANSGNQDKKRSGTIDVARTDVSRMYSQTSPEVKDKTLDELTIDVRNFMTNWETMTAETIATVLGVGIPVVVGMNVLWFTLEMRQALKGNPDYLNLVFSLLATVTAGGAKVLGVLYKSIASSLKGGGKSIGYIFDLIYQHAKKLGIWDKLKPIFEGIKTGADVILDKMKLAIDWLSKTWLIKGTKMVGQGIGISFSTAKTWILNNLINPFDTWLANIGTRAGVNPEVSKKLGSAARWGSTPFAVHKGIEFLTPPSINPDSIPTRKVAYGSYLPN
jgi:hypothetical protein